MPHLLLLFILNILLCPASVSYAALPELTTDFTQPEPGEEAPGGAASQPHRADRHSFSKPLANLDRQQGLDFRVGRAIFDKLWVFAPSSTTASDGLGPLYNARSCAQCHRGNGRGQLEQQTPLAQHKPPVSLFLRLSRPDDGSPEAKRQLQQFGSISDPVYGRQLQTFAWPDGAAEGRLQITYTEKVVHLNGGEQVSLRQPKYDIDQLGYGPLHPQTRISPRFAPAMIGLGLLEAISDEDLKALSDPLDEDNNGISGRLNRVWDREQQRLTVGRFGWKATAPTLNQQNLSALNGDIGISSSLYPDPYGDCTDQQADCRRQANGNSSQHEHLEAPQIMTRVLNNYTRYLAVPRRHQVAGPATLAGKALFYQAGCVNCHRPSFVTRGDADPRLASQHIWPYSDLLLHDMGSELADQQDEFSARGNEWRTPPLWGLGLTQAVAGQAQYLHDGRARTLLEAILWHAGEGRSSRQQVINMTPEQRQQLMQFLESL